MWHNSTQQISELELTIVVNMYNNNAVSNIRTNGKIQIIITHYKPSLYTDIQLQVLSLFITSNNYQG